jgi:hypothetical protein
MTGVLYGTNLNDILETYLLKNHLLRKAEIYMRAFSHCANAILFKLWLLGVEGAIMGETVLHVFI